MSGKEILLLEGPSHGWCKCEITNNVEEWKPGICVSSYISSYKNINDCRPCMCFAYNKFRKNRLKWEDMIKEGFHIVFDDFGSKQYVKTIMELNVINKRKRDNEKKIDIQNTYI